TAVGFRVGTTRTPGHGQPWPVAGGRGGWRGSALNRPRGRHSTWASPKNDRRDADPARRTDVFSRAPARGGQPARTFGPRVVGLSHAAQAGKEPGPAPVRAPGALLFAPVPAAAAGQRAAHDVLLAVVQRLRLPAVHGGRTRHRPLLRADRQE